jgi:peptidyl-dipeptidase A
MTFKKPVLLVAALACAAALLPACTRQSAAPPATASEATEFVKELNRDMGAIGKELNAAGWTQATYITADTQYMSARANERNLELFSNAVNKAKRFDGLQLEGATARTLAQLKVSDLVSAPAPNDAAKRAELATIMAHMEATYGEGKYCITRDGKEFCRNIDELSQTLVQSRDNKALTEAWAGWHQVGRGIRSDYVRFVELANEGARELGFADLGAMWRSRYDMTPEQFEQEVERLWGQVTPLYSAMQCYARTQLAKRYGEALVPAGKPIPAQLFGNLWAQQWNNIYEDILKPYPAVVRPSLDSTLVKQKYTPQRMTQQAEAFYTSLGMQKLPDTFWQRSMLSRPRDREVVCHASAWHMDGKDDVRIKQCITPTEEELGTIYHELGHVYYYLAYQDQPYLFQNGAHDGFHEAIGDTVLLSMTPTYLAQIGLGGKVAVSKEAVINEQMKMAADKIAFLPFGKLVDQWRWKVFSGEVTPANYNKAWWDLRLKYQGIAPPTARSEEDFDPGAKYHVPGNTPYTRYFLSFILQFQFHRALCQAAGLKGPLHECSVFNSKEAGQRFQAMLAAGSSQPWKETLEKLTGTQSMDASAIIEYFAPLMGWLEERNKGQQCGWSS